MSLWRLIKPFFSNLWIQITFVVGVLVAFHNAVTFVLDAIGVVPWLVDLAAKPYFPLVVAAFLVAMLGFGIYQTLQAQKKDAADAKSRDIYAQDYANRLFRPALTEFADASKDANRRLAREAVKIRILVRQAGKLVLLDQNIRQMQFLLDQLDRAFGETANAVRQVGVRAAIPQIGQREREFIEQLILVADHYPYGNEARDRGARPAQRAVEAHQIDDFPGILPANQYKVAEWHLHYQRANGYFRPLLARLKQERERFGMEFGRLP